MTPPQGARQLQKSGRTAVVDQDECKRSRTGTAGRSSDPGTALYRWSACAQRVKPVEAPAAALSATGLVQADGTGCPKPKCITSNAYRGDRPPDQCVSDKPTSEPGQGKPGAIKWYRDERNLLGLIRMGRCATDRIPFPDPPSDHRWRRQGMRYSAAPTPFSNPRTMPSISLRDNIKTYWMPNREHIAHSATGRWGRWNRNNFRGADTGAAGTR